jgi:hypothetical protein
MFHIGQRVVCIDAGPQRFGYSHEVVPKEGQAYTIRAILPGEEGACLLLDEIRNKPAQYLQGLAELKFAARRFRPLTDISLFEKMRTEAPVPEAVD